MSGTLEARVGRLEELLEVAEVVELEDGRRVSVEPGVLIDSWLAYLTGEPLPVAPSERALMALVRVEENDPMMAQIKGAARRELGLAEVTQ